MAAAADCSPLTTNTESQPMHLPTTTPSQPLATLHYVMRGPVNTVRTASIEAVADGPSRTRVSTSFDDAVRAAQLLASTPTSDGIHRQPINVAHGLVQATEGAWDVYALGGEHRDAFGPIFIDGRFFDAAGLGVHAERHDRSLQAIVGTSSIIDLRLPPRARPMPLPPLPAGSAGQQASGR